MAQRRIPSKITLVSKDLKRANRLMNHVEAFGPSSDRGLPQGRYATHDRVAMCLLRKDIESFLPVRRETRIARNRRRLKILFSLCVLWWLAGRFLV